MDWLQPLDLAYARFNAARTLRTAGPSAFRVETFGRVRATIDPARAGEPYYNRAVGLTIDDLGAIEMLLRLYEDEGIEPRFDVTPDATCASVSEALVAHGFRPETTLTWLQADPAQARADAPCEARIEHWPHERADDFLDLLAATGAPIAPGVREQRREHYCTERFRTHVALIDDVPVAWATLFVHERLGLLGNASTLEPHRRRGCHAALLQARLRDAADLGLEHVASDVEHATTSCRNNERAGLRMMTVHSIWTRTTR